MRILWKQIISPLAQRLGTATAAYLVALGVANDTANTIALGLTAAILVGVDLVLNALDRRGDR